MATAHKTEVLLREFFFNGVNMILHPHDERRRGSRLPDADLSGDRDRHSDWPRRHRFRAALHLRPGHRFQGLMHDGAK